MTSTTVPGASAASLAAATPPGRDRYVDLLRVASLGVVIAGHWLMAVPVVGADGGTRVTNVLALVPRLQPITWLLQVMPVFFLVGGFAHATALASIRRRGGGYPDFARSGWPWPSAWPWPVRTRAWSGWRCERRCSHCGSSPSTWDSSRWRR
jgi:hypothetical protein